MPAEESLKVLVADDSVFYRKVLGDILREIPGVTVVGTAENGNAALVKIGLLLPDLVTLDVEMPEMNGLEVLSALKRQGLNPGVVMVSTLTRQGGDITVKALELGAFDFILKPQQESLEENRRLLKNSLLPLVKAYGRRLEIKRMLAGRPGAPRDESLPAPPRDGRVPAWVRPGASKIVGIGISTGGPQALARMLPQLPADLGVPVLVVQHMPPVFTRSLAASLNGKCAVEVLEAQDQAPLKPSQVLIAPGGKQMKIGERPDDRAHIIRITDDPPENSCKPSADYLFRSLAHYFGPAVTAVIMTGMGSDGAQGLKMLKSRGAVIIAQDAASCVVYGMPREPVEAGIVDVVAPLDAIAGTICRTLKS